MRTVQGRSKPSPSEGGRPLTTQRHAESNEKKTRPDCLTSMYRHCGYPTISMSQKYVASSRPHDLKSKLFEKTQEFFALQSGQASHTDICWIPTSSSAGLACLSSKQTSTTSLTRFMRVSRFFACVWQPRKVGTVAT
jgi:hypothetical protein